MNYYNEWGPQAAAWLRELISERLIPRGLVDERSITEVKAEDLEGFTQCHFFAGIGGWPLALQLAGVDHRTPLWTGSPPCQPFSAAGKQLGQFDPRHLAPVFLDLISQCRPPVLFGEQVAPAIAKSWMCDLQAHLEGEDYAVGFAVLPACSVGAPHKRDRLFFGANRLANTSSFNDNQRHEYAQHGRENEAKQTWMGGGDGGMADTDHTGLEGRQGMPERTDEQSVGSGSVEGWVAHTKSQRRADGAEEPRSRYKVLREAAEIIGTGDRSFTGGTNPHHSFWSSADWLGCRDGKFRPVESGTFPLANGISARVGRLRGYGNAIVPEVAAQFVRAFLAASDDAIKG
jgi:DNA (cytosine-5)-methyltransferase 1